MTFNKRCSSAAAILTLAAGLAPLHAPLRAEEPAQGDDATRAHVLDAIETYVREDQALKGKFLVLDPRTGEPLALAFDHVHSAVHPHEQGFRACVDFTDAAGVLYDVDVVVAVGDDVDEAVHSLWVHKVAGEVVGTSDP